MQAFGNVGLADDIVLIRKHALLELRRFEDIFELEFAALSGLLILFGLLHLQRPVVICAIAECSPVVFFCALVQPGSLQPLGDKVYARLRDVAVVFDLVFKLVVLDEVVKLVAQSAPRLIVVLVYFVVGKDVVDAPGLDALLVATLQALESRLFPCQCRPGCSRI